MNPDEERFEICLQCCEEQIVSPRPRNPEKIVFPNVIDDIREDIENYRSWHNEIHCYQGCTIDTARNLCWDCPYRLEHIVLAGKPIDLGMKVNDDR